MICEAPCPKCGGKMETFKLTPHVAQCQGDCKLCWVLAGRMARTFFAPPHGNAGMNLEYSPGFWNNTVTAVLSPSLRETRPRCNRCKAFWDWAHAAQEKWLRERDERPKEEEYKLEQYRFWGER